jgi:hypothetical protein
MQCNYSKINTLYNLQAFVPIKMYSKIKIDDGVNETFTWLIARVK